MKEFTQPRQALVFAKGTLQVAMCTKSIALQDINMGSPHGELINEPIDLPIRPLLLLHEAGNHELLNALVMADSLKPLHECQQVFCNIVRKCDLDEGDEKVLRFINREVAWCEWHSRHPYDTQRRAWHFVYDALYHDEALARLVSSRLFRCSKLTMRHVEWLCRNRITEQTMSGYKKRLSTR